MENPVTRELLTWYRAHRRDLPWRRNQDPYAVWVSEMMLQQTQVATAIPFFERWMARFPNVRALADAPLDDVLKAWQGLGYYARARNLHKAAQQIVERHNGAFPSTVEDLRELPGIGAYTAGAIGSIALRLDVPLVDANVIRVLARLFAIAGDPKSTAVQKRLWEQAEALLPPGEAGDFNQGLMELGALVCASPPVCARCPLQSHCAAYAQGETARFPELAARPVFTQQTDVCALVTRGGRRLLTRRPLTGLWGGLWELPRVTARDGESVAAAAERAAREIAGLVTHAGGIVATVRHGVTTRKITLHALACEAVGDPEPNPVGCDALAWVAADERENYPLSSPQSRLWEKLGPSAQPSLF